MEKLRNKRKKIVNSRNNWQSTNTAITRMFVTATNYKINSLEVVKVAQYSDDNIK